MATITAPNVSDILKYTRDLEDRYVATLGPEQKEEFWKQRAIKAEEETVNLTLGQTRDALASKYPLVKDEFLELVGGKTVPELEASFERANKIAEKSMAAGRQTVQKEFQDKFKDADAYIKDQLQEVYDAWGMPRAAETDAGQDVSQTQEGNQALREAGVALQGEKKPTDVDGLIKQKVGAMNPFFERIARAFGPPAATK